MVITGPETNRGFEGFASPVGPLTIFVSTVPHKLVRTEPQDSFGPESWVPARL